MKSFLRITHGNGVAPHSERVYASEADSEMAANTYLRHEAEALIEFADAEEIPASLLGGAYVHMASGPADERDGCRIEVYRAVEG